MGAQGGWDGGYRGPFSHLLLPPTMQPQQHPPSKRLLTAPKSSPELSRAGGLCRDLLYRGFDWGSPRESPQLRLLQPMVSWLWGLGWCLSKEAGPGACRVLHRWCGNFWVVAEVCAKMDPQEKACWSLCSQPGESCLAVMLRLIYNGK